MSYKLSRLTFCVAVFLIVTNFAGLAEAQKVERTGAAPAGVSDALRQAAEDKGYKITLDDGWSVEFWFARQLKAETKDAPGALYPELSNGEFIGVVRFPQGMADYRGQSLAAGIYTLRYQLLPQDGNHMGVSPNPDFLLASPAVDDARPEQSYVYRKLIALSVRSTSTGHPAVLALQSPGAAASVAKDDKGDVVFSVDVPSSGGASEKLGIVIKGAAAQ
jgi:hypothetical protein